jgi:GTPase
MEGFTSQDMGIIRKVLDEGRPIIIGANKYDLMLTKHKLKAKEFMNTQVNKYLGQVKNTRVLFLSAKTGHNVHLILKEVANTYDKWNLRISTSQLNNWLQGIKKMERMPNIEGRHLNLRYIMQIKTRPPTFYFYVNDSQLVSNEFEKYLRNSLISEFKLAGVPVRILMRDNEFIYKYRPSKRITFTANKIKERIQNYKKKKTNITYKRRLAGSRFLYGKKRQKTI